MRQLKRMWVVFLCFSSLTVGGGTNLSAQSPEAQLQTALDSLHEWLGTDENAQAWRRFLKSDDLTAQVAKGRAAERKVVREILARYAGDTSGLDKSRFVAVRQALETWAQDLAQLGPADLPQVAREALQDFTPSRAEDVQSARTELVAALERLDSFLAEGSEYNANRWKEYLHWADMETQLKAETNADSKALSAVAERYCTQEHGLELTKFVEVRAALHRYANALALASSPDAKDTYQKHLTDLTERLQAYAQQPKTDDSIAIGKALGWLEKYGQAKDLIESVRKHYWKPNLYVQLSEDMLKTGVETDVDEHMPVEEVILGTSITGQANLRAQLSLDLVPSEHGAAFDILLLGTTASTNVGYNGPVTIYSQGLTTMDGRKRVFVDAHGFTAEPARAACQTTSTINDIAARFNIVRNIAWNKATASQPEAEAIASERAARRLEARMDEEAAELLQQANDLFSEKFRKPLVRRDAFPKTLRINTTDEALLITALETCSDQLGAPNDPPALNDKYDLAVRVHESLVANSTQAVWGGVTLTDERLQEIAFNLTGSIPDELAVSEENDPWSITFASERPIEVRFDDQGLSVWIRGTRFTRGDQEIKRSLEIAAKYRVEKGAHGVKLTRLGDVEVNFAKSNTRQSVQQVAMRTFMKKKFEQLFKAEVVSEGLALGGRWQKVGKFRLQQLQCDDGWLVMAWKQPSKTERLAEMPPETTVR
jgi:hypothetical protein